MLLWMTSHGTAAEFYTMLTSNAKKHDLLLNQGYTSLPRQLER
jgi:hypothetical protein